MQIKFSKIKRTNLACPSEWKGHNELDEEITLTFRYGRLKLISNGKMQLETSLDAFDLGGYLSDENLALLLEKHKLLITDDT